MEIDFGKGLNLNWGIGQNDAGVKGVGAQQGASGVSAGELTKAGLTITQTVASSEDIAAANITDAMLARDDALGKLVNSAFSLPPPPMPNFAAQ